MENSRLTGPLEYLVFGLKPMAPDAIRSPYYVGVRMEKRDSYLEFFAEEEDVAAGDRKALQRLAEAVVEDVHFRHLTHLAMDTTPPDFDRSYRDIAFSFTPPYSARVRGIYRDAAFPLDEESRTMFISYVFDASRKWAEKK